MTNVTKDREAHPPAMEAVYREQKHGIPTVAAYAPLLLFASGLRFGGEPGVEVDRHRPEAVGPDAILTALEGKAA